MDQPAPIIHPLHVCVCICTFKRPRLLRKLLDALPGQKQGQHPFTLSVVVVDNDAARSAETVVVESSRRHNLPVRYESQTERNFAVVRNTAVQHAEGDFIAFIDDDEYPVDTWLEQLLVTLEKHNCSAALGPVRPYFEQTVPRWLERSKLCDRPALPTGQILNWSRCRTGNVLLRRSLFSQDDIMFDPAFRTGGEDVDFFKRAHAAGHRFVWCEEAPAYELVPPERIRASYHLRRALLQGGISLGYGLGKNRLVDRIAVGLKSVVACVLYTIAIPFVTLAGRHLAMRLLVKDCHHIGRLSKLLGIPLIRERNL